MIEVSFSVSPEEALPHFKKTSARLAKNMLVPGFRKGKVPYEVLQAQIGESVIMENALEDIVGEQVAQFLAEGKTSVIGRPRVDVEKLAPGNPIVCTALFDRVPIVTLPDFSSLSIVRKKIEVNDDVAKTLEMIDLLFKKVVLSHTPALLVDQYADEMMHRFERDLAERDNTTLEKHLEHMGKPREDFDKEVRGEALKQVQTELILDEVVKAHGISASDEDVLLEVEKLRLKFILARMEVPRGVSSKAYRSHIKTTVLRNRALEFLKKKIIVYEKA